ncbi:hypothetical protein evm_000216 [Chilo suppressalis]|nr:hypothetical protein evm_000216 [Chilo suppressalis]
MDLSPVQSSVKCGSSDFSIERILSNESVNQREQNVEPPSWLCCTRYQPPRVPRSGSSTCRSRRSGRHARVPFTAAQAEALEAAFARAPYLAPPALRALAAALQLRDDRIKIWFQNRRARMRREKSSTIDPPRAVTLPPTAVFATQGLLAVSTPWNSPAVVEPQTILQTARQNDSNDTHSFTRNLTRCTTSRNLNEEFTLQNESERPDSPLDIESVD